MIIVILASFFNGDFEFLWLERDITNFKKNLRDLDECVISKLLVGIFPIFTPGADH
jgi:hypothetical protein